jgi:hypothetical protein
MLTETKLAELRKLRGFCDALISAHEILAEPMPADQPEVKADLAAWKLSQSNRILANDPAEEKGALLGTLSTEPTVSEKSLTDLDLYPSTAAEMVKARDEVRAAALALRVLEAEPVEELMEIGPGDVGKIEDLGL